MTRQLQPLDLTAAARRYIAARHAHTVAAEEAMQRLVRSIRTSAGGPVKEDDGWAPGEVLDEDGVALTHPVEHGAVTRHRWRMKTSVEQERAEAALREAAQQHPAGGPLEPLRAAVLDLLEELGEPFYGWVPGDAAGAARSKARIERHNAVFERLREAAK